METLFHDGSIAMNVSFFKILAIFTTVAGWCSKALEDGKVTAAEAAELAVAICEQLGIKAEIDLSDL